MAIVVQQYNTDIGEWLFALISASDDTVQVLAVEMKPRYCITHLVKCPLKANYW